MSKAQWSSTQKKWHVCCWCLFYSAFRNAGYHLSPFKEKISHTSSLQRRDSTPVSAVLSSCNICSFRGDYLGFSAASVMVWRSACRRPALSPYIYIYICVIFRQSNPSVTLLIALEQFSQLSSDWSRLISTVLTTPNISSFIYLYIAP